jgi:hypothetical protein
MQSRRGTRRTVAVSSLVVLAARSLVVLAARSAAHALPLCVPQRLRLPRRECFFFVIFVTVAEGDLRRSLSAARPLCMIEWRKTLPARVWGRG